MDDSLNDELYFFVDHGDSTMSAYRTDGLNPIINLTTGLMSAQKAEGASSETETSTTASEEPAIAEK